MGAGSAAVQPLDWWRPLGEQASPNDPCDADLVLAAECVWLRELVDPFADTVVALLQAPKRPACVLAFRERAKEGSQTFSSLGEVLDAFASRGVVAAERGVLDAPESRGLLTTFYELTLG